MFNLTLKALFEIKKTTLAVNKFLILIITYENNNIYDILK